MPINYRLLALEIQGQADKVLFPKLKPIIQAEFLAQKRQLLDDFDNHDVTRELQAGPQLEHSIVGIDTKEGGNLFSLLGFPQGSDPTSPIRAALDDRVQLRIQNTRKRASGNTVIFETPINYPTLADIDAVASAQAPLPWTTRGYVSLLERGIPGFGHYLFSLLRRFNTSFSGTAIQIKPTLRSGSTGPIKYVSQLLADFKRRINPSAP